MTTTNLVVGDKVTVDGLFLARVISIRGVWATIEEVGTRRRDDYQIGRLTLAR